MRADAASPPANWMRHTSLRARLRIVVSNYSRKSASVSLVRFQVGAAVCLLEEGNPRNSYEATGCSLTSV